MVYNSFRNGTETPPPAYPATDTDPLAAVTGGMSQPGSFTTSVENRQLPTTSSTPSSNRNSLPTYVGGLINFDDLLSNMDIGLGSSFPTFDQPTNLAPVQEQAPLQMLMDLAYVDHTQPATEYNASRLPPSQQFQQFPMGGYPNEVWDSFMQELTRDGYTIPNY